MKRIYTLIFAILAVAFCAVAGSVFLTTNKPLEKDYHYDKSTQAEATIPSRTSYSLNVNGGTIVRDRSYQIGDAVFTNYGYGFSVNANGYMESQNKGIASSYSMIKIQFSANESSNSFTIRYISYGESSYDYAIFSNLDTTLSESSTADTSYYKRTYGEASPYERSVTYSNISKGTHYVYVKYRKDGSVNDGNDTLQFFIETDLITNGTPCKYQFRGMMYGTLPTATRSGYLFDGWYTAASGGTRIYGTSIYNGSNLYAHWIYASNANTVTFDPNGGKLVGVGLDSTTSYTFSGSSSVNLGRSYMYGDALYMSVEAYSTNWASYASDNQRIISCTESGGWNIESAASHANIEFAIYNYNVGYAHVFSSKSWASLSSGWHTFELSFDGQYARGYVDGTLLGLSEKITSGRIGYNATNSIFLGAEAESSGTSPGGSYFTGQVRNLKILNISKDKSVAYAYAYGDLPTPVRANYTFDGWYTAASGGTKITSTTTCTRNYNHTLYAHWVGNSYTLTYDVNGGNALSTTSKTVTYMGTYGTLPTPTRTGYTFNGWYTASSGGTQVTSSSVYNIAGNSTIYAHWSVTYYTINVYKSGSGITSVSGGGTYAYGSVVTISAVVQSGYSMKWTDGNTSNPRTITVTGSASYTATGTANQYKVFFDYQGGSSAGTTISVSDADLVPTNFALDGDGWWVSQNSGYHNSYAYAKVYFYVRGEYQKVTFECINYGELGYDYGIMSQLNCDLAENIDASDPYEYYSFRYATQNVLTEVSYDIYGSGEYYITIKYRKDGSVSNDPDCFKFRITGGVNEEEWGVSSYTVPFNYEGDGYWVATNQYADSYDSFAMAKIEIDVEYDWQEFYLYYQNYTPYSGFNYFLVSYNYDEDDMPFNPDMSYGNQIYAGTYGSEENWSFQLPQGKHYMWIKAYFRYPYNSCGYLEYFKFKVVSADGSLSSDKNGSGFVYDANNGYYKSTNHSDSSYSLALIRFTTLYDGQTVNFVASNSSGYNEDYGMFGYLDEMLPADAEESGNIYHSFRGYRDGYWDYVSYYVERAGEHFVCVKYIKDGSGSYYEDCFRFYPENIVIRLESAYDSFGFVYDYNYGYYKSTNHEYNSYSLAVIHFTTYYNGQNVTFRAWNAGEYHEDFGMFGNLDEALPADNYSGGNIYFSFEGYGAYDEQSISYYVDTAGEHYIYVKYIKRHTDWQYEDCFMFYAEDVEIWVGSTTFDFAWDEGYGYYRSTNHAHESYSIAVVRFRTDYDGQYVNFWASNSSGYNEDYGMFGYLDRTLPSDAYESGDIYFSFCGYREDSWENVSYYVERAGEHFIYIKYIKDGSGSYFEDCFRFYAEIEIQVEGLSTSKNRKVTISSLVPYYVYTGSGTNAAKYQFSLTSDGYYTSTNAGRANSFSVAKVTFTTTQVNQIVTFACISYGENYWDYGIMSQLDVMLPYGNGPERATSSSVYYTFYGKSSPDVVHVSYVVPTKGTHFITIKYIKDGGSNYYNDSFKFKYEGSDFKYVTYNSTYGTLPSPTRTNYTFDGWWTSPSGGTQVTSSNIYNIVGDQTVYAHWKLAAITVYVYLRAISSDGNTTTASADGGSVNVTRTEISGTSTSRPTVVQTSVSATYSATHQGQQFTLTANANPGYVFAGISTSSSPSASIKNPTAPPNTTVSYYPTGTAYYYVYFKQVGANQLKYDSVDKYFYFEDGYYPQSEATVSASTLNSSASPTGESFIYNDGIDDVEIPVYSYGSDRYVRVTARGETKWFKFEPIRWRISDYGVANTERNISRYTTLLKFQNYTSYAQNFVAVSDLILGVGAMHNTRNVQEGDSITDMVGFQNIQNTTDGCTISFSYMSTANTIKIQSYATYSQGNTIYETTMPYTAPLRVVSMDELETVGFANKQARASDMVAFILGVDKNNASYWTRDLSNLGSGVSISASGTKTRSWLNELLGVRFAYTFSEGSNASFY